MMQGYMGGGCSSCGSGPGPAVAPTPAPANPATTMYSPAPYGATPVVQGTSGVMLDSRYQGTMPARY
jgi:hypothetical protein